MQLRSTLTKIVIVLAVLCVVFNAAAIGVTSWALANHLGTENNPVAAEMFRTHGILNGTLLAIARQYIPLLLFLVAYYYSPIVSAKLGESLGENQSEKEKYTKLLEVVASGVVLVELSYAAMLAVPDGLRDLIVYMRLVL